VSEASEEVGKQDLSRIHHALFHARTNLPEQVAARRDAKRRLVEETRRLVEEAAMVDAATADDGVLDEVAVAVGELVSRLAGQPSLRRYGGLTFAPDFAGALDERSPISGQANPLAAPLRLWFDGEMVRGSAVYSAAYEGPPNTVHGGHVAAAFDEVVGVAQTASGMAGMTGTLSIRMVKPTPLRTTIRYEGGVERTEGRKIFVWARSYAGETLTAEASAIMIMPKGGLIPPPS
jgi:acyl-coenzyme A thioesterase PaaI-like protein